MAGFGFGYGGLAAWSADRYNRELEPPMGVGGSCGASWMGDGPVDGDGLWVAGAAVGGERRVWWIPCGADAHRRPLSQPVSARTGGAGSCSGHPATSGHPCAVASSDFRAFLRSALFLEIYHGSGLPGGPATADAGGASCPGPAGGLGLALDGAKKEEGGRQDTGRRSMSLAGGDLRALLGGSRGVGDMGRGGNYGGSHPRGCGHSV